MSTAGIFARGGVAAALIVAGAAAAHAQSVDCTTSGALQTAINGLAAGQTLTITGNCTGAATIFIGKNITLTAGVGGGTINEALTVLGGFSVTMNSLIIDGTGLTSTEGVSASPYGTVTLSGCTIEHWTDGVRVNSFGSTSMSGGVIENNTGSGVDVRANGNGTIGEIFGGTSLPVEITANGIGVTVDSGGSALLNALNIHANAGDGVFIQHGGARIVGGTFADNGGDGLDIVDGSAIFTLGEFGGTTPTEINGNSSAGVVLVDGHVDIDQANIHDNGDYGIKAHPGSFVAVGGGTVASNSGGGIYANGATVKTSGGVSISGNTGNAEIQAVISTVSDDGGTISAPTTLGHPAILAYRSSVTLNGTQVTGPTNSNALGAFGGTSVLMYQATLLSVDASDAALQIADGSSVVSAGGNTIENTASSTATAITVTNGSTFDEQTNAVLTKIFAPAADTITGGGTVQMQSNMELGTGASVPSGWTGSISVAQNSSFRMHGGMTISGGVALTQGSNGFFNKAAGGSNTINGTHVTCTGTGTSHVVGPAAVTPAVTMATTGVGCYVF